MDSGKKKSKKGSVSFVIVKDGKEAKEALKELGGEKELALMVDAEDQGTLFGSGIRGLILGSEKRSVYLHEGLLKDKEARKVLEGLFSSKGFICHDAKEVMKELEGYDLKLDEIAHDTLIAAYLLAAGERKTDLDLIVMQELGIELDVGEKRNEKIAGLLFKIADLQRKELKKEKLDAVMKDMELPLISILRDMERAGMLLDIDYLKAFSKEVTKTRAGLEKKMEKIVGHAFNPASPIQLAQILFEELELPTKGIKRGKTGYSTAASELEKLEGTHEIIGLISEYREVAKLLTTYIDVLPNLADKEGRIHTTLNQAITSTGRLSSSDPNLQNIPIRTELGRKMRHAFIAPKGMLLLSCDYSQIDLRTVAALSKDKKMLDAFKLGADIHAATAANIHGISIDKVTKEQRRAAKAINFGILYGQGPVALSRAADISFAEAKDFIARYFETYKGIKIFLEETKELARANGYVETMFGRRRPIPDIMSGIPAVRAGAERMAINMPVQGTAADLMKMAMIEIAEKLPKVCKEARMIMQVHDEVLLEVPKKEVEKVAVFVKETMEGIADIGCPLLADAKAGENWEEMEGVSSG